MPTFEAPGPIELSVDCPVGEVLVTTTDAQRAEVAVTPLRDDETSREAVARTVVELRGDRLVVEVPRRSGMFGREPSVRIDARVPHGSGLSFRTASADVVATGRLGEVRGKTASGDVRVAEAEAVRIGTASGDVTIERAAGAVDASVVSGNLRVGAAERGGSFTAVSGDVEVGAVGAGDVDVRTVSGDVTVGIAAGSRVHVDVTTVSGDLRSDVELGDVPDVGAAGPLVTVRGRTVSGDLRVRPAALYSAKAS